MKYLLISLALALAVTGASAQKKLQRFNPVYGSEADVNQLLTFVSSNIKVELNEDQTKGVDGYMVCKFKVDTLGNIHTIRVQHALRPWIDYAIIGAMNRLPAYGIPSVDRKGRKQEVDRQLVFSFGSFTKPLDFIGFNGDKVRENIDQSIQDQIVERTKKNLAQAEKWNGFTNENSKLRYDSREALKGGLKTLPGNDPIKNPVVTTPTITVAPAGFKPTKKRSVEID